MGVKKGQDNFSKWRKKRSQKILSMVEHAVAEAKKHKLKFDDENKMAAWVATRINIHRTTMTRSIVYMQVIRDYLYEQSGVGSLIVNKDTSNDVLHAKIKSLTLETTRKENEIKRLSKYIENNNIPAAADEKPATSQDADCESKISDLCAIIRLIHERVSDQIEIDRTAKEIRDLSVRGTKQRIVSGKKAKILFDWLDENEL